MKMNKKALLEFALEAVVTPCSHFNLGNRTFDGGVFDKFGNLIELSLHEKGDFANKPIYTPPKHEIKGTFIYAGLLQNAHFGHFLIESLSRLWALDEVNVQGIVFISREQSETLASFIQQIFKKLGVQRVEVCLESTRFEKLIIPSQLAMQERGYVMGYPQVKKYFSKLPSKAESYDKVYVSRSLLKKDEGNILGEKILENNLKNEGYHIVHPQTLSIDEQIKIYSNAKKLIFSDGSAFHLFVLVANTDQKAFVVWRRNKMASFAFQYKSFVGKQLFGEPTQKGFFQVSSAYPVSRRKTVLDFDSLYSQLFSFDFISGSYWDNPSKKDIETEVSLLENRNRTKYHYVEL